MTDMTLSVVVTRAELSLSNLELQDPANGYSIYKIGPGAVSWRRETAKAMYAHGGTLVTAVKDLQVFPMGVRVRASSAATKETRLAVLLAAFSQFSYTVITTINGIDYTWVCQPADWSTGEGGEFDKFYEMVHMTQVDLSITRSPTPSTGVM